MSDGTQQALPIVFEGVHVTAGAQPLLRDVTLQIAAGPPTVLIGPNGAGKTTLLRTVMGLARPAAGRVLWGVSAVPVRCAMVFQKPVMLRRSVAANVHYALAAAGVPRSHRARRVAQLLEQVGLGALARRPAPRLSAGERQRLGMARALALEPAVLLLDEPTASLDPAATLAVEQLVRDVSAAGVKVVMSSHDLGEVARLAGDVVLLHRGTVVEAGSVTQLLTAPLTDAARRFVAGELLT